jgi:hypothetical protein
MVNVKSKEGERDLMLGLLQCVPGVVLKIDREYLGTAPPTVGSGANSE